ncbi:MAG: DUF3488 domain-containing protein [Deltaproteobacteria bacterium]|nr:DUF3488 domain-containing protein [Deltaproteobacteria bacterium]
MRLYALFKFSSFLLILSGLTILVFTHSINYLLLLTSFSCLILSFFGGSFKAALFIGRTTLNLFVLFSFGYAIFDFLFLSGDLMVAATDFLLLVISAKLFNIEKHQDYLQLYALTLFLVIAAANFTIDLWYLVFLIFFLFLGLLCLILYNLTKELINHEYQASLVEQAKRIFSPYLLLNLLFVSFFSLSITFAIFFSFPRIGTGFLKGYSATSSKVTGFSHVIDLDNAGTIYRDPQIVMRVEIPEHDHMHSKSTFYWKGIAFDFYDGKRWRTSFKKLKILGNIKSKRFKLKNLKKKKNYYKANFFISPTLETTIFLPHNSFIIKGDFPYLLTNNAGWIRRPKSKFPSIYSYSVIFSSDPYDYSFNGDIEKYLELPNFNKEIKSLVLKIIKGKKGIIEKSYAIRDFLRKNYKYTLKIKRDHVLPPLEEFLFIKKKGYCEQFATAMAILLRYAKIPCRVVAGYSQGEWNKYGGYFIVRQQDAHAWVEVFIPHKGWVIMDPSPEMGIYFAKNNGVFKNISKLMDAIRLKWMRYVIQYSLLDQIHAVKIVKKRGHIAFSKVKEKIKRGIKKVIFFFYSKGLLIIIFFVLFIPFLFIFKGKIKDIFLKLGLFTVRGEQKIKFYQNMIFILSKKGKVKKSNQTPYEFLDTFKGEKYFPYAKDITDFYYKIRFGKYKLNNKERERIKKDINFLKKS